MRTPLYGSIVFLSILLISMPIAVPVIKTSASYSMFNTGPYGCSDFAKILYENGQVVPLMYSFNKVGLSKLTGTLIIVRPNLPFTAIEAREVRKFLSNGGTLFLADNFGTGNMLLSELNISARFANKKLLDLFYSKNENFPVVVRILDSKLSRGVKYVILDEPTVIVGLKGLVYSSKVSTIGGHERSYPLLAVLKYGKGRIVLLSDPNILTNSMFKVDSKFLENLVFYISPGPFYFDEAHHADFNPYSTATVYIQQRVTKEDVLTVILLVAALAVFMRSGAFDKILGRVRMRFGREDLLSDLPEWVDREKLERMIQEIKAGSKNIEKIKP